MWSAKTWLDHLAQYPNRRTLNFADGTVFTLSNGTTLTLANGSTAIVTVERNEGEVSTQGDAFSAANMNGVEERGKAETDLLEGNMAPVLTTLVAPSAKAIGDHFIYNGQYYVFTSPVSSGGTIILYPTSGYNAEAITSGEEIAALKGKLTWTKLAVQLSDKQYIDLSGITYNEIIVQLEQSVLNLKFGREIPKVFLTTTESYYEMGYALGLPVTHTARAEVKCSTTKITATDFTIDGTSYTNNSNSYLVVAYR